MFTIKITIFCENAREWVYKKPPHQMRRVYIEFQRGPSYLARSVCCFAPLGKRLVAGVGH